MSPPPTVSVVLPTFNRAHLLPRAIESVVSQTFTDWEIVLVDDGSADGTPAVVADYARKLGTRFVPLYQANKGSSAARNRGIDAARGRFVAFLDSDDEFLPRKIERQLALFALQPQLGFVYSDYAFIDLDGRRYDRAMVSKMPVSRDVPFEAVAPGLHICPDGLFDTLLRGYFIATIVGMVRRDVLASTIRFPVGHAYAEEWLFYLHVAKSCRAGFVDEPLCIHHATPGSLARTDKAENLVQVFELLKAIKRSFPDFTREQHKTVNRNLSHAARQLGYEALRCCRPAAACAHFASAFRHEPTRGIAREFLGAARACLPQRCPSQPPYAHHPQEPPQIAR